ncbi:hypothetical protein [Metabacillus idriensis]|uniref:hypothetical protein n=1 Tax=Metabacillus idriensis TaxID=324768 RepID=UPI001CD195D4|nr:hypothetical protein [Metabacillus idriensis]
MRKDYFIAYMKIIMNGFECSTEHASVVTFERLFRLKEDYLGNERYKQFIQAYEEIKK